MMSPELVRRMLEHVWLDEAVVISFPERIAEDAPIGITAEALREH